MEDTKCPKSTIMVHLIFSRICLLQLIDLVKSYFLSLCMGSAFESCLKALLNSVKYNNTYWYLCYYLMSLLLYVNFNIFINLKIKFKQGRGRGKVSQCQSFPLGLIWDASRRAGWNSTVGWRAGAGDTRGGSGIIQCLHLPRSSGLPLCDKSSSPESTFCSELPASPLHISPLCRWEDHQEALY